MIDVKRRVRARALSAAGAAGLLVSVSSAEAAAIPTILFDDAGVGGGTLFYDGNGGPLTTTGALLDVVVGLGTAANSGLALTCEDCALSFTTGANVSESASFWTFLPGGNLTVSGTAKEGASTIATGTLLSGLFNDTTYVFQQGSLNINVSGSMNVTVNPALAAFYATPANSLAVITQINLKQAIDPITHAFSGTLTDTDINYYSVVPVPAALPLLLTALAAIVMLGWRRTSGPA